MIILYLKNVLKDIEISLIHSLSKQFISDPWHANITERSHKVGSRALLGLSAKRRFAATKYA
jgi:hypothetical protein